MTKEIIDLKMQMDAIMNKIASIESKNLAKLSINKQKIVKIPEGFVSKKPNLHEYIFEQTSLKVLQVEVLKYGKIKITFLAVDGHKDIKGTKIVYFGQTANKHIINAIVDANQILTAKFLHLKTPEFQTKNINNKIYYKTIYYPSQYIKFCD